VDVAGRWSRDRAATLDALVVAALVVADLAGAAAPVEAPVPADGLSPLVVLLSVAMAAPFRWRRRRPLLVLGLAVVAAGVGAAAAPPGLLSQRTGATVALAVYAVGSWSGHRRWATALPSVLAVAFIAGGLDDGTALPQAVAAAAAVVGLPWALGVAARARRAELDEARRRAEAAEQERDEQARRAVVEERAHIARELHDVVAHHVSLIGVQAGAARTTLDRDPESARAALGQIEEASRRAVGEMRHLLDALRDDESGPASHPQPGLTDLDGLLAGFRATGLDVTVTGTVPAGLGAALDLTCYRLVEESLTNVTRHSAAARAQVRFTEDGPWIHLVVEDPGPARPGRASPGRGRLGKAERTALFGGSLTDGPTATGGWLVSARLRRDGEPAR
jgi:signal transduction histidine kinase